MKQRVLSLLMALLGIAAGAQADGLVIGGAKIEDGAWYNTSWGPKCLKAGTIKYDDPTHVTFENVTLNLSAFVGVVNCAISSDIPGLYITLVGENKILAEDIATGLYFSKSTSINGDGSLSIVAGENAIEAVASAGLTITDAHVKAEGGKYGLKGVQSALTIKGNGILEAYGGTKCVGSFKSFREGTVVTAPEGATFKSSVLSVVDKDGNVIKNEWVTIQHAVLVNETNFPDKNFRNWILKQDYGKDGIITDAEISDVTMITVFYLDIASLQGIEFFTALTCLECGSNQLTVLDVSKNTALEQLSCSINQLTALDVSKNTALTTLNCSSNPLGSLDVSQNTNLTELSCSINRLTALDVSKNTALTYLNCGSNELTALDVSQNTALTELNCYNNKLTALDVSQNTTLTQISCYKNAIRGEKMTAFVNSLPTVTSGYIMVFNDETSTGNEMTTVQVAAAKAKGWRVLMYGGSDYKGVSVVSIDETNFPDENFRDYLLAQSYGADGYLTDDEIEAVEEMPVYGKEIASLKGIEYFTALTYLSCSNNQLTALDVSKNTDLTCLQCDGNKLTALDVTKNTALTELHCYDNQLATLNVAGCTELTQLWCYNNKLNALNVSENTKLKNLRCEDNQLAVLDVTKNTALNNLVCGTNLLTALDVSKNTDLEEIYCYQNAIRGAEMDALVEGLPDRKFSSEGKLYVFLNETPTGNKMDVVQVNVAKEKNWKVLKMVGGDWVDYEGEPVLTIDEANFPDEKFRNWILAQTYGKDGYLSDTEIAGVTAIDVSNKGIESLKGIEHFTALQELTCINNQLTTLDVSGLTALIYLRCYGNAISGEGMTTLVNSLPAVPVSDPGVRVLYVHYDNETPDDNKITAVQVKVATDKGWKVVKYDGTEWVDYAGVLGDVNGDDRINGTDIQAVINFIVDEEDYDKTFDINGDEKVNGSDIQGIINIILEEE